MTLDFSRPMTKLERLRELQGMLEEASGPNTQIDDRISSLLPVTVDACGFHPTHSLDAALGLVERTLPDCWVVIEITKEKSNAKIIQGHLVVSCYPAPTAPLAILKAWVAAMFAQLEGGE